jgi:hypothetical protein
MREMVWHARANFAGWACSKCRWEWHPPNARILADGYDSVLKMFEEMRDKAFAAHSCDFFRPGPRKEVPK